MLKQLNFSYKKVNNYFIDINSDKIKIKRTEISK